MSAEPAFETAMTAEEFFAWAEARPDGQRYELLAGYPVRMQSEKIGHAECKLAATLALRDGLRNAGLDTCRAFIDGVSVRISNDTVREPDAVVHCGPYDSETTFVPNPVVVVEVVSPSTARIDVGHKMIDYFSVPSILHYLIVYGDEGRVIHHRRARSGGEIATAILGRDDRIDLSPPGFTVTVEALLES